MTTSDYRYQYTIPTTICSTQLVPSSLPGGMDICPTVTITITNHLVPTSVSGWGETCPTVTTTISNHLVTTSVSGWKDTCEGIGGSVVITMSAVSLLLIVTLTTVILTQCLLMIRMRRSIHRNKTHTVVMTSTTVRKGVPVSSNDAYAVTKMTTTGEEVIYELVK